MSRVIRIKHLKREDDSDNFDLPAEGQKIVKVIASKGNNLHEVEDPEETERYLVSMPTKFRKSLWIKRGDYVIVESIAEGEKVKAEIVRVLSPEHEKEFSKVGVWPKKFTRKREHDNDELYENPNRIKTSTEPIDMSSSTESDSD